MKILTLLLLMAGSFAFAQNVNIPDAALKAKLLAASQNIDANNDGEIQYAEALVVTDTLYLNGTNANPGNIVDLTGIEAFENVTGLQLALNKIETFNCQNTQLRYLNLLANELTQINVSNCPELTFLNCHNNQLTALDINSNPLLSVLYCGSNSISELNTAANTELETLDCGVNNLSALDITNNTNLYALYCFYNNITTLNLYATPNLRLLSCGYNPGLSDLYFFNTPLLVQLNCVQTAVTNLNLSVCPNLQLLVCTGCSLLEYINLKNGHNITFSTTNFNLDDLPLLEVVCIDDEDSYFASWVAFNTSPSVSVSSTCILTQDTYDLETVSVYPNPASTTVYIDGIDTTEVVIFNSLGQKAGFYKNTNSIDVSVLPAGVYLFYIKSTSGASIVKKVVKNM